MIAIGDVGETITAIRFDEETYRKVYKSWERHSKRYISQHMKYSCSHLLGDSVLPTSAPG